MFEETANHVEQTWHHVREGTSTLTEKVEVGAEALLGIAAGVGMAALGKRTFAPTAYAALPELTVAESTADGVRAIMAMRDFSLEHKGVSRFFTPHQYLPPRDTTLSFGDFRSLLGWNPRRLDLIDNGMLPHLHVLKEHGADSVSFAGSMASSKWNPGDYDGFYRLARQGLGEDPIMAASGIKQIRKFGGQIHHADQFLELGDFPGDARTAEEYFSYNRAGKPVGTVSIDLNTLPNLQART